MYGVLTEIRVSTIRTDDDIQPLPCFRPEASWGSACSRLLNRADSMQVLVKAMLHFVSI
jgi:hypothetical protein